MKKHLFLLFLISFSFSNSFGQNKKEQIEQLNYRVDSLVRILDSERSKIKQQKTALEQQIVDLNNSITKLKAQALIDKSLLKTKDEAIVKAASENAKFGQPEINLGIIPGYGGTQRLPKIIGKGRAMEMIMTGKTIDSAEAFSIGLINHVCTQEELMSYTTSILKTIIEKSTIAIAQIIKSINASEGDEVGGYETEAICFGEAFKTDDMKEGVTAFLEKRKPVFKK
jgi:hypothetical protein